MPASIHAAALLAALLALPARAALDPVTDRQVGGVFSNACSDRSQVMVRLYGDTLDVERGGVAVKAGRLKSDRKPPPGPPVAAFAATVQGQVKDGPTRGETVGLTLTHDAKGLFVRIDGSEKALAPLGAGVAGQTLRHCDPNRNALPGVTPAPTWLAPSDLLKDARFKAAYGAALGPRAAEPWLATLNGPAPEVRPLTVAGAEYALASSCKPHDCFDHNLVLLWQAREGKVYGLLQQKGRQTLLGAPPPAVATELPRIWAAEFRR